MPSVAEKVRVQRVPRSADVKVHVNCPCCEGAVRYLTNRVDESFTMSCFQCEAPVELVYNERKDRYESL